MASATLLERLEADGIENLWVVYQDYSGRSCAKTVPKERFETIVARGVVFARANLSMMLDDHQPAGAGFLANTGDFMAVPDPVSYARLPYQAATARVHAFMRTDDGSPWEGCPRTRLQRMVEAYASRGLGVRAGFEPEFILFQSKGEGWFEPVDRDGMFTVDGLDRHHDLWQEVVEHLRVMGVTVDQLGKEYGPAQYEATTGYAEPITAVDNYLSYKEVVRSRSRARGLVASFMPKPYDHLPGSGLHVHLSLWDAAGERELSSGDAEQEALSETGARFAAGLLEHAGALCGVGSPIVNSYKRLLPGSWAPAHVCWGIGNRSALVRVPGLGARRHLEFRAGDNAANPFIFLTALLAAGLDGIERELALPAPVGDDVGHLSTDEAVARGLRFLPRSLPDALAAVEADSVVTEALGPVVATEFLNVKRSELATYDLVVHPWERQMYLEAL